MSVTSELLETMLRADPLMNIHCEGEDEITLDFMHHQHRPTVLTLRNCSMNNHSVDRVHLAMRRIIGCLAFCGKCNWRSEECRRQHVEVLSTLRMVLGKEELDRLLAKIAESGDVQCSLVP